jgi:hypothetical protein
MLWAMASNGTKVGLGFAAGFAAAKALEKIVGKDVPSERDKSAAGSAFQTETYNGIPVSPVAAEVIREMRETAYEKIHGPPPKTYTPEDVQRVFDPPVTPYANALRTLSPDLSARVDAIEKAPDLQTALHLVRDLPEVFQISETGSATIFELRIKRIDPDATPNNWVKTYATSVNLVAERGALHNTLRVQAVRHDSVRENYVLRRSPDSTDYDHVVNADFMSKFLSRNVDSAEKVAGNMEDHLTPAVLGQAVRELLTSGRPTRVEVQRPSF